MEILPSSIGIEELILCEKDRKYAERWTSKEVAVKNFKIHNADFMELEDNAWISRPPVAVVSNLPYSAGTAIVTKLARYPAEIPVMVLMFQTEVARRLRAEKGTKDWGSLSIWIQNKWLVQKLFSVSPKSFKPPPKVDSEVVILTPRKQPLISAGDYPDSEVWLEKMLKAFFQQRRKMLRASVGRDPTWRNTLELAEVDGTKRAEVLGWDEWTKLLQALLSLKHK